MTDSSIPSLLKKTEHYDKDERYMATSDLCEVLKRHQADQTSLELATERQICTAVLRLLHDNSNDVQAVAVKTLGVLLTTVQEEQIIEIANSLTDQVLDAAKSELRDVYAIGLQTLVKTIPTNVGDQVSSKLVTRLLDGVQHDNEEIVLVCLDILTDLLQRFGASSTSVTRQHEAILQICLHQLASQAPVARKRCSNVLACLSVVLSDGLLERMVQALLSRIDQAQGVGKEGRRKTRNAQQDSMKTDHEPPTDTNALIRCMCTVAGGVGHRLGQAQIDRIVPILLRFTDPADAVNGEDDNDDESMADEETSTALELRESCFTGFESFLRRCPKEVEPHLENIVQASLAYMAYDPNYTYDDEDDEDEYDEEDEYDNEEDDYDEDDDDDDDDECWKVRRSAIRVLKAVVESKKNQPSLLWHHEFDVRKGQTVVLAASLVDRFKEREENCRVGVLDCFARLLTVTVAASQQGVLRLSEDEMSDAPVVDIRTDYVPKLVKACEKILSVKKGGERSKSSALAMLSALCKAPGGVGGNAEVASVFKHINPFLATGGDAGFHREGTSKALRLDALSLVRSMLAENKHVPTDIRRNLQDILLPELCESVKEQWYKVIAEALRGLAAVPRLFVVDETTTDEERANVAESLYMAVEPLLAAHDVDQEIKECALQACASLLSCLHSKMEDEHRLRLLSLLLERLQNETTRVPAIKTLSRIASAAGEAETPVDLSSILADAISSMASLLKLAGRSLKQTALEALNIVVQHHGSSVDLADGTLFSSIAPDLAPLVVDKDLHLCHLSLKTTVSILKSCVEAGPAIKAHVLEPALDLAASSALQEPALDSLLSFFSEITASKAVVFDELVLLLRQRSDGDNSKLGIYHIAKSIAAAAVTSVETTKKVLEESLTLLQGINTPIEEASIRQVQLSLLITGDIGQATNLGTMNDSADKLKTIYLSYFDSSSDDLKTAASHALGNASVGSPDTFLPAIVGKLDEDNQKQQYLLLSALREFIQRSSRQEGASGVENSLSIILTPLEKHTGDKQEGVRTMVAECIGSLVYLKPDVVAGKLAELQKSHETIATQGQMVAEDDAASATNAHVCWTIATSIKLAIANKVDPSTLAPYMTTFCGLLHKDELHVTNAALLMVFSAMHHMPQLLAPLMVSTIMPALYRVSELKLERKVDLGPFTHTVDDALPLRKSALSIFALCMDTLPGSVDMSAFVGGVLVKAMGDAEDVQLHAHQIVLSMCSKHPGLLVDSIDGFVDPLEKTLKKKPGQKSGSELERLNDWLKSALRVLLALAKLEGSHNSQKFVSLLERAKSDQVKFGAMFEALAQE